MAKQKFATQVDPIILEKTRAIAQAEGKQLQAIIEEALLDLIEKRHSARPRAQVMALYEASVAQYKPLYERLSK